MTSKDVSAYLNNLMKECKKLTSEKSAVHVHAILKNIYQVLKKSHIQVPFADELTDEEYEIIFYLVKALTLLLVDNNFPADIILLCGTCLTLFIASVFNAEFTSSFLIYLYCYFDEKYSGNQYGNALVSSKEALEEETVEEIRSFLFDRKSYITLAINIYETYLGNVMNSGCFGQAKTPSFQQIAILNGIASCQILELYSFQLRLLSLQKPFLIFMFTPIHQCCLSPSVHQYHAFHILLNFLKMCEMCMHIFLQKEVTFFHTNSEIVQNILSLLESNWQSPIKGTNAFIKKVYKYLITLNEMENGKLNLDDMKLIDYMLKKTMMLSWQVKGKFFLLSVILQHINYSQFFEENPDVPLKIISSMKANYIASSVAEVYKVLITSMMQSDSKTNLCSEWCKWWRGPLLNCLHSNDRLLIQNITNNVLPWTMKQFPKSYELLIENEEKCCDDSVKLLLLRIAKGNLSCALGEKELSLIEKNLHHNSLQIRTEIFSILCSSPKKSEPVNSKELDYIKSFIEENLNIDSAPFHQHLLAQLHILLNRIRDSLAQEHRLKLQHQGYTLDMSQVEFVDWLACKAIQNTFPGACFQRRRVSLQILNIIYDVFIDSPMGYKRKEKPSKAVKQVIQWCQANDLWMFFQNDTLMYILPSMTDFADEIRSLCANLLQSYSTWPMINKYDAIGEDPVVKYALSLCNHPDFRNNDGGAHICCIIFHRLCNQTCKDKPHPALEFLKYLVLVAKLQLKSAKDDLLSGAIQTPIHGMLLALQYCFRKAENFLIKLYELQKNETLSVLKDSMDLCFDVVQYMLRVMKGENENYYCPSFSDIGKALEKLVFSKKDVSSSTDTEDSSINVESNGSECSDYTSLCDLILSCCWHSIKNSCFLLCELSSSILTLNIDNAKRKKFLGEIAKEFSSILISCRHRGVVEACCEALNNFCVNLSKDKAVYEAITMGLLKSGFDSFADATMVSVTRRSAGLPLLFQAVVCSEENNISRQLLSYTIENLLNLINEPLPSPTLISEKTDLPQAHAYHILKALVLDARLSQSILPYFDAIIPICITGFSSTVWAIRNGALQLFGVILPRVCGQKKVREEDSDHNTVSAFELFARCPSLKTYLLQELTKCVQFHKKKRLCSELVPILSLLVKLMPEQEDQRIFMMDFTPLLCQFLNIPVWKVRDLISSALSLLMQDSEIMTLLDDALTRLKSSSISSNQIHSILLIVQKFMTRKSDNILSNASSIEDKLKDIYSFLSKKVNCPLLLGLTIHLIVLVSDTKHDTSLLNHIRGSENMSVISRNHKIGLLFYECKVLEADLKTSSSDCLLSYIQGATTKNKQIQIVCLQFLSLKLKSEKASALFYTENSLKLWKEIFASILDYISPEKHPSVVKEALSFMIDMTGDWNVRKAILSSSVESVINHLMCHVDAESGLSISALSFTMWSICLRTLIEMNNQSVEHQLEKWNLLFSAYCQPRSSDVLRLQAARSLAILGPILSEYLASNTGTSKDIFFHYLIDICEGSFYLLQDEDEDVRNEACKFPSYITQDYSANILQFNVCIKMVFQYMFRTLCNEPSYLLYLWNRHQNYPSAAKILQSYCTIKKFNLFEQEYVNVFAEPHELLLKYHFNFKAALTNLREKNYDAYREKIYIFLCDAEVELQDVYVILSSVSSRTMDQNFTYHHQVYLTLKKLKCQVDALLSQKSLLLTDDPLCHKFVSLNEEWKKVEKLLPSVTCWFLNIL